MRIELNIQSDNHNLYCENKILFFEFFNDGGIRENHVWINIDGREVSVNKDELKKVLSIL